MGPSIEVHNPATKHIIPNPVENLFGPSISSGTTDKQPRMVPFASPRNTHATTLSEVIKYCKSGNFRENYIFANSVKRHTCDAKNSRLGHDLRI